METERGICFAKGNHHRAPAGGRTIGRLLAAAAVGVLAASAVVGCGGDDEASTGATTTSAPPATTAADQPSPTSSHRPRCAAPCGTTRAFT